MNSNGIIMDLDIAGNSKNYANWMAHIEYNTCLFCITNHGRIVDISVLDDKNSVMAHPNCRCVYVPMRTKFAGTATEMGVYGADFVLAAYKHLPDYYVTKDEARAAGWKNGKNRLTDFLPGMVIGGDLYRNENMKLPMKVGRLWYEADINYNGTKKRNRSRIVYSNDGLIFVTYDHFHTFYEIIQKEKK